MTHSYRNPFSGVNAVQLGTDSILEYWCSPFAFGLFSEIDESDIYEDEMNIALMGGRSTGKSMFLRYWSFPVQFKKAERDGIPIIELIQRNRGIGFYFRIDGPILRSFQGYGLSEEHWTAIFTHYFELTVTRQYIQVLRRLNRESALDNQLLRARLIPGVCELLEFKGEQTLDSIILELDKRIDAVDKYRAKAAFYRTRFRPQGPAFVAGALSFGVSEKIIECMPSFEDLNLIILLDEYENFSIPQQQVVNGLLKFTRPQIKFRLGMRLEGFRTFGVLGREDFIKEGREYRRVVFEDVSSRDSEYRSFLAAVARKRLEHIEPLREKDFIDIKKILGAKEDLEDEARDMAKSDPERIMKAFRKSSRIPLKDLELVKNRANPLLELLNIVWLARGIKAEQTVRAMTEYLAGEKTPDAKKYQRDYVDKYKLSLMFLLCSIYKKEKNYYSFNTFAFLSSGIVGQFLELCRRSFARAEWHESDEFFKKGIISKEHQTKAAFDCSSTEKHQINRIEDYGGMISTFVDNLGNIFRRFHTDFRMRYPETNQFAVNIEAVRDQDFKDALKAAIRWSVIQQKRRMHRSAPGEPFQDTYALNRIFAPIFQISYRTRGGKSLLLDEQNVSRLMLSSKINPANYAPEETLLKEDEGDLAHPTLFR